ncbi:MAG: hypothetical protein AAGB02_00170 [Pseudomonadota bacterium]
MSYTAYAATMQGVWFSHDDGENWSRLLTPTGGMYNEARCWAIETHPDRPGNVLAGTDQGLYRYTREKNRFDYVPSPMDDLHILQIARDPNDPNFIVCGTRPGEVFISEDDGESWTRSKLAVATECWFINTTRVTSIKFDPRERDTIWATVEIDGAFRSRDRGKTWELLVDGLVDRDTHDMIFLDRGDGREILMSTEAGVHRSRDNGASWVCEPIDLAPWPYFRSLRSLPGKPEQVLASVGDKPSGETGMVLLSEDFGATWREVELPHPVNSTIWSFATHPGDPNLVFFATIFGQIYRSKDGGASWTKIKRELGEIRMIAWEPSAPAA